MPAPSTQASLHLHPNLGQTQHPLKGRALVAANGPIRAGELVMADVPYAVLPTVTADDTICSNPGCSRRIPGYASSMTCEHNCSPAVRWCSPTCKHQDRRRHGFECGWLKHNSPELRQVSDHDYHMLWIVVRMLAARSLELEQEMGENELPNDVFASGWPGVQLLRSNRQAWPTAQVQHWRELARNYLQGDDCGLPVTLDLESLVELICAEETNVFELCPGPTEMNRGEPYGLAVFLRVTIANHSCVPNVSHQADGQGRMIVTALRDLAKGEECCTSYFDLAESVDVQARREKTEGLFTFTCTCSRCLAETATVA
ncbi:hypothetical protein BO94DRAFT_164649 [Aspergillus sclerotioniger CBS 115572]|uniref:SET domain-containing protein n=1 Tax=Aspergillus sclerotioniger CBS 115572 TaxID=1450535 RepID=A0A317VYB6_9EURO|nr:hypothetical protein BO94DRAFT_164649 [Aspergillus sclerotioniger CBS 115572]PWY79354.1 hypothetical protein BO94DRAFT_164649 [Aspergillus sclerotioniger CBS 115572]